MSTHIHEQTSRLLDAMTAGDQDAAEQLMPMVYDELKAVARRYLDQETARHTLQPTGLVHEAYVRLVKDPEMHWQGRSHFFAVGAKVMRRILVDHARGRQRQKRGGGRRNVALEEHLTISPERPDDLLALDAALEKLALLDERQARIVEMRFFGGLTMQEVAEVLDVSKRTVEKEWTMVRAWLRRELSEDE